MDANKKIVISNKCLISGGSEKILDKMSNYYSIPKLEFEFTININEKSIGVIGLNNILWANERANLNIFLDKEIDCNIVLNKLSNIINDYIEYVHKLNIYNVMFTVNGSNKIMIDLIKRTKMEYYGVIPFGAYTENNIESNYMFQHIPNMKKRKDVIIPENKSVIDSLLYTKKKKMEEYIELKNGFKLIAPKLLEHKNISIEAILNEHIKAMQNRDKFTIPLGEDKYILQKGNEKYGLFKAFMNYTYIVLNRDNDYAGYISILRTNANGKNAEIEIGIAPKMQHKGLGTVVINRFYEELFSIGYACVTSAVFEFNTPSLKLHEKVAKLNGVRLNSYYANNKLWNLSYYSKVNSIIENN